MGSGKYILRLIDLVFIILFGFIAISQFSRAKEIELPKSSEAGDYEKQDSARVVIVSVQPDGSYPIDDGKVVLADSSALHRFLMQTAEEAAQENRPVGIRIRAKWNSPFQYTSIAMQICKELDLPKGLDVIKVRKNDPLPDQNDHDSASRND